MASAWVVGVVLAASAAMTGAFAQSEEGPRCKIAGSVVRVPAAPEASGLVASRSTTKLLWMHNDSGKPLLLAVDTSGKIAGTVPVTGVSIVDWEAIASAPCGKGSCLYLGDIGDNNGSRKTITIYRVPEPASAGGVAQVDAAFSASYPDGAHDAEALLASPDGRLYVVTKGVEGPVALYRLPTDAKAGATVRLERIGSLDNEPDADARVTDGAISHDGEWVALRTRTSIRFYRANEFLAGKFREVSRTDLKPLGEPQGEAITFGAGGTVYVAGEGGGKSAPGTFAELSCPARSAKSPEFLFRHDEAEPGPSARVD
jgi:hypothetical protein